MQPAYASTDYRVQHPAGSFTLRVGARSRRLDALLSASGHATWAFLTAWNPQSGWQPLEQNALAQRRLEALLLEAGYPLFAGRGEGSGDWQAEASVLALGIREGEAVALARMFRQAALVVGARGEPARLVAG